MVLAHLRPAVVLVSTTGHVVGAHLSARGFATRGPTRISIGAMTRRRIGADIGRRRQAACRRIVLANIAEGVGVLVFTHPSTAVSSRHVERHQPVALAPGSRTLLVAALVLVVVVVVGMIGGTRVAEKGMVAALVAVMVAALVVVVYWVVRVAVVVMVAALVAARVVVARVVVVRVAVAGWWRGGGGAGRWC